MPLSPTSFRRDEDDHIAANGDPHEIWYRYDGKEMGRTGNDGGQSTSYGVSVGDRSTPRATSGNGPFRHGSTLSQSYARFAPNLEGITTYSQGSAGGSYTVRAGATLQGIAAQLWGDADLWYKLAEANGLAGGAALSEGQRLTLPSGISRSTNTASTFKAYDLNEALGDTNPISPNPTAKNKNKCGALGAILLTVVAVAVTALVAGPLSSVIATGLKGAVLAGTISAGTATTVGAVAGGALAGIAGSVASQGLGLATGLQDKFSFKQVAMAGIAGGIGGGLSASGAFGGVGSKLVAGALRGAAGSALTQGIGVAIGLQSKFDFAGVAAAGLGGGLSAWAGSRTAGLGQFGSSLAANTAGGIANAAARTLISGGSFGDNLIRALPDVIGSTIGNAIAGGLAGTRSGQANAVLASKEASALAGATATGMKVEIGAAFKGAGGPEELMDKQMRPLRPGERRQRRVVTASEGMVGTTQDILSGDGTSVTRRMLTRSDLGLSEVAPLSSEAILVGSGDLSSNGFQDLLDTISTAASDWLDSTYNSYVNATGGEQGVPLGQTDISVAATHTILKAVAGIPSVLAHPQQSTIAMGGYYDSYFMDNRSVGQVANDNYQAYRSSSSRQITLGTGRFIGNTALAIGPTRFAPELRFVGAGTGRGPWTATSASYRAYLRDIEVQTGLPVTRDQRLLLADALRQNRYGLLSRSEQISHRRNFDGVRGDVIAQWEANTGGSWPRYSEPVFNRNGTLHRQVGDLYDAHHIIENSFGGPHEWWNIHPARAYDQHQAGIHRSGSPSRIIFRN